MTMDNLPRKEKSQSLLIYPSTGKVLWRSTLALLCLLAGLEILRLGSHSVSLLLAGILILVFLGLGPLLFFGPLVLQVFASSALLIINDEGMQVTRRSGSTLFKWEEIGMIDRRKVGTSSIFVVTLTEEGKQSFLSRQSTGSPSRRSRRPPSPGILISQSVLPLSVKRLIETIQQRYQGPIEHYHIRLRL
jgi:hypothetical protein